MYFLTPHIFYTDRILSPSTDSGRPKHGQNCPLANFRQKGVWFPMHIIWPFLIHLNISLRFWLKAEEQKISVFHWFPSPSAKKVSASCTLNFDATHIPHIASLNRYTPKFSGVPQKLTWCNFVGVQHPPKSAYPKSCPLFSVFFGVFFGQN